MTDTSPLAAAERWAQLLDGWSIPQRVLDQAEVSPWDHEPSRFRVDDTMQRDDQSARWAREVLPPLGGTVLDVGCGGGRSSIPLVPPATELIGVDASGAMLDEFVAACARVGVARRTVHGLWPDVAPTTPTADVVVCHHVVYNVSDIVPFVWALTDHARLAVVVELPTVHPMSAWAPAWQHFWGLERPDGPAVDDFVAVLRELGLDPEFATSPRSPHGESDLSSHVRAARRRLCLPSEREDELGRWLAANPPPFADTMATIRWAGAAEPHL